MKFRYVEPEREAARSSGEAFYYTGRPCSYGHVVQRRVANRECVECSREKAARYYHKDLQKSREYQRTFASEWRRENPDKFKETLIRSKLKKYGLTIETFQAMLSQQDNCCAICKSPLSNDRFTHVDHCHKTTKVRGILCNYCNLALGAVKESPQTLRSMAAYLESHGEGA